MSKEKTLKEIDVLINEKNHLWNALIITIGGSLTLLFSVKGFITYLFFIVGILFAAIFLNGYFRKDDLIKNLLTKIDEET